MKKPPICIVTPALADANNGNWQTAKRWARMLSPHYRAQLLRTWPDPAQTGRLEPAALIALHARRSAASVAAWASAHPGRPLVLVLTGTDLYRDIHQHADARRALDLAHRLVVLQDQGPLELPPELRFKARVVYQSGARRQTLPKTDRHLRALMVGHLREEKMPQTYLEAARLLRDDPHIRLDHIGAALDPALGEAARQTARDCPAYRWLGALPHAATLERIQRAHVLVLASRMEGGAHVILEAAMSGTPVLASHMPGNLGMLGEDYGGYFPVGDAAALAGWLRRCRAGQAAGAPLANRDLDLLGTRCAARTPWFEPAAEQAALLGLMGELL